jgi:hypothetical protein
MLEYPQKYSPKGAGGLQVTRYKTHLWPGLRTGDIKAETIGVIILMRVLEQA